MVFTHLPNNADAEETCLCVHLDSEAVFMVTYPDHCVIVRLRLAVRFPPLRKQMWGLINLLLTF